MTTLSILLQAAGASGQGWSSMAMIALLIVIFYFMMIRPQQKKQKEIRKQREAMKEGDKVITAGGIYGRIKKVNQDSFMIEIDNGVVIRVDKNSVYTAPADAQQAIKE